MCPYAIPLSRRLDDVSPLLRIVSFSSNDEDAIVSAVRHEAELLVGPSSGVHLHETTLLVFDSAAVAKWDSLVRLSWKMQSDAIVAEGYGNLLQLVLFHPQAVHSTYATTGEEDAADFSIRSPFPTVHLLREEDVMRAVRGSEEAGGKMDLRGLPAKNKAKLRALGAQRCADKLAECYRN